MRSHARDRHCQAPKCSQQTLSLRFAKYKQGKLASRTAKPRANHIRRQNSQNPQVEQKSASAALSSADSVKDFNAYFKVRKKSLERQLRRQNRAQRRLVSRAVRPAQPIAYQPRMMVWSRSGPTATIEIFTPVISSRCSTYFRAFSGSSSKDLHAVMSSPFQPGSSS